MVVTLPPTNSAFAAQKNANWSNNFKFNLKKKKKKSFTAKQLFLKASWFNPLQPDTEN